MAATVYIGIKQEWDYVHITVTLSMSSYVRKDLHRFQNIVRGDKEYSTHTCAPIQYVKRVQYAEPLDAVEYLSKNKLTSFNKCVALSYTMPSLSITLFYLA